MVRHCNVGWLVVLAAVVVSVGCRSPHHADQDAFAGGLIGSGIGAIVGHQSGNTAEGAIVGGIAGALVGNAVGEEKDYIEARNRQLIEAQMGRTVRAGIVTHGEVITMSQSGVGDDLIINHLRHHGVTSRPTANDLVQLKSAGVSDAVVMVMQEPPPAATISPVSAGRPVIVEEHYYGVPHRDPHYWHPPHHSYRHHPGHHRRHHGGSWDVGVSFGG